MLNVIDSQSFLYEVKGVYVENGLVHVDDTQDGRHIIRENDQVFIFREYGTMRFNAVDLLAGDKVLLVCENPLVNDRLF